MTFELSKFVDNGQDVGGHFFFPNGYGVSVVRHQFSYGGSEGLFEMAVLSGDENKSNLCYDTPITNDVLGWLTFDDVVKHALEVAKLPQNCKKLEN